MGRSIKLLLLLFFTALLYSEEIRIEPKQYWVSVNKWESPFTPEMLIESSLAASGLSGETLNKYIDQYRIILNKFRTEFNISAAELNSYSRGEYVLKWMHKNILGSYLENQTLMDNLLDTGYYNCVSSAILYLILTREAGLSSGITETKDHAFSTVVTENGTIDVETTTPYGFNPGVKQEFHEEFKKTGFTYVPPGNYRIRKSITDKNSIALILQNRMSALQKKGLHDQVIGIAIDRWTLSETDVSRKDMNDAFRNWAAVLNNRGEYQKAFNLISNLSDKYKLLDKNKDLLFSLAYNNVIKLVNLNSYSDADIFLKKTEPYIKESDITTLKNMITEEKIKDLLANRSYTEALPAIREAYNSNKISENNWKTWITIIHQNKAFNISEVTGWWDAWQYLINLPENEKSIQAVKQSAKMAHENWSITIHNSFVDLYNSGQYKKAEQLLVASLKKDQDNTIIKEDLDTVRKQ